MSLILLAQCKQCRAIVGEALGWEGNVPSEGRIIALPTPNVADSTGTEFSCVVCKAVLGEQIAGGAFVMKGTSKLYLYNVGALTFYLVGSASGKTNLISQSEQEPVPPAQGLDYEDIQRRIAGLENVIILMQNADNNDNDNSGESGSEKDPADDMLE